MHLLTRHRQRAFEIVGQDQFREFRGAGDIGPFANNSKPELRRNIQRLEPGKLENCRLRIADCGLTRPRGAFARVLSGERTACPPMCGRLVRQSDGLVPWRACRPRRPRRRPLRCPQPRITFVLLSNSCVPGIATDILKFFVKIALRSNQSIKRFILPDWTARAGSFVDPVGSR